MILTKEFAFTSAARGWPVGSRLNSHVRKFANFFRHMRAICPAVRAELSVFTQSTASHQLSPAEFIIACSDLPAR